jgi:hypothetical protein
VGNRAQFAIIVGVLLMLKWFAVSWDTPVLSVAEGQLTMIEGREEFGWIE